MSKASKNENIYTNKISQYLRPVVFEVNPSATDAGIKWSHWRYTFINFLSEECTESTSDATKLKILVNHLSPDVYSYIQNCTNYDTAMTILNKTFLKPKNELHARHILSSRTQLSHESVRDYSRVLQQLSHDCEFKSVSAEQYRCDFIRDTFIAGIKSPQIRQRLLENYTLTLDETLNQAISLEMAEINSKSFQTSPNYTMAIEHSFNKIIPETSVATTPRKRFCFFCGGNVHRRVKCPAVNETCQLCLKKGHFANVCRSNKKTSNAIVADSDLPQSLNEELSAISAASPSCLRMATISAMVNGVKADALIDTGSSMSFIDKKFAKSLNLQIEPCKQTITLASLNYTSYVEGACLVTLKIDTYFYYNRKLLIINNLCADIIIGHDLLKEHSSLELSLGGQKQPLKICNVMAATVPPVSLFTNLSADIKPIAIKSRRYSEEDTKFIEQEINKLVETGVIEPSLSPWRAQVLLTRSTTHRKRLVIDYSLTINKYTHLDAYPLPSIESIISKVAGYEIFSQIDLKSAYHQIPIKDNEKMYTAFEACGNLYQFCRIPFGVTNGVAAFQRTLDFIIQTEHLKGTYAYLDDVTICGINKNEHDSNLEEFMKAVNKYGLTLNKEKCFFSMNKINLLGYTIENKTIRPDSNRIKPLLDLPLPKDASSLKRTLGLFAHYSKWIKNFSEKIHLFTNIKTFPISKEANKCFESIKNDIVKASLQAIDHSETFTVESDASDHALAATLSQNGRPVAFFSRSLSDSEKRHSTIEKEACAIVEALRKWRHYLIGRYFILITDQKSVSFMFNQSHTSKIKNDKIERWRLELSCYKYDIIYRPGKDNITADALSRVSASIHSKNKLYCLHDTLCHPGINRMWHWIKAKNLPFSINDIKSLIENCPTCAKIKPRFIKPYAKLIKATSSFERLNMDFKGPLPSNTQNKYLLTIIDEFSRFPFAFPCKDMSSTTVIKCLQELFSIFGTPLYIHSDRGASFMSQDLKQYLITLGIACSRTTPYNPEGNGQIERFNGTLWKSIELALCSKTLSVENWEQVLPIALHSIRSLLCTATNMTPHDRIFNYSRRSSNGDSLPSWLMNSETVLMKKNFRASKYEPLTEEVQLLEANPTYSYVRLSDGRETTVSNRRLAPIPQLLVF